MPKHQNRVALSGSERVARSGSRIVGAPDPNDQIQVSVRVRPRQPLPNLASGKEIAGTSLGERKYLSRAEFAAAYGADPADLAKIEAFAHRHNLTVVEVSAARRTVLLSGTVAAMSAAFGVYLAQYEHNGARYRGRTGPVYIPQDLSGIVQGVFGLDNRPQARPHFRKPVKLPVTGERAARQAGFTPPQVAQIYSFPTDVDGTGQCIGILEFGGGYTSSDLDTYFQQIGISTPSIAAVSVDGFSRPARPRPGQSRYGSIARYRSCGLGRPGGQYCSIFLNLHRAGLGRRYHYGSPRQHAQSVGDLDQLGLCRGPADLVGPGDSSRERGLPGRRRHGGHCMLRRRRRRLPRSSRRRLGSLRFSGLQRLCAGLWRHDAQGLRRQDLYGGGLERRGRRRRHRRRHQRCHRSAILAGQRAAFRPPSTRAGASAAVSRTWPAMPIRPPDTRSWRTDNPARRRHQRRRSLVGGPDRAHQPEARYAGRISESACCIPSAESASANA